MDLMLFVWGSMFFAHVPSSPSPPPQPPSIVNEQLWCISDRLVCMYSIPWYIHLSQDFFFWKTFWWVCCLVRWLKRGHKLFCSFITMMMMMTHHLSQNCPSIQNTKIQETEKKENRPTLNLNNHQPPYYYRGRKTEKER